MRAQRGDIITSAFMRAAISYALVLFLKISFDRAQAHMGMGEGRVVGVGAEGEAELKVGLNPRTLAS